MKEIVIREAIVSDAAHIALLGRVTFTETFSHHFNNKNELLDYFDQTFSVQKIKKSIDKPNNVYWIALVDELPVGYAKLKLKSKSEFITSDNISQLQKIYILKDFLSMKIGHQLQERLIGRARENNSEAIWLSVLGSNDRAINFYYKNDFIDVGNHDFQIGSEKFKFRVMSKKLN